MPRLFLFAIGGTGSRVLKAFTMLLASGVKSSGKFFEIVPIIIDPHKANEDLKRTVRLLDNYQRITQQIGTDNGFFATPIATLDKLVSTENRITGNFTFTLGQVANTRFRDYISFNQMDESNKAFCDLLFSGTSINKRGEEVDLLDIEMDIGFVGNPNIGSVVLDQVKDSEEFKEFASNYNPDDRIFIISSIFGGTGAAGFPAILKNLRNAHNNPKLDGRGFLRDARIGALTVLPYFNIESDADSAIQKADFISKSKSALSYYRDNVNDAVNALYYIADDYIGKAYKNDPGDNGQKNDAHFIELAAALAIIDFLNIPDSDLESVQGKATRMLSKGFGIRNDVARIRFSDFEDQTQAEIEMALSQFMLFRRYMKEQSENSLGKESWNNDTPRIDQQFMNDTFYRTYMTEFLDAFEDWMREMAGNSRSFAPFNHEATLDALIADRPTKSGLFSAKVDYNLFNHQLSKQSRGQAYRSAEQKLVHLFHSATREILTSKFGIKS